MSSSHNQYEEEDQEDDEPVMLDADEAAEEFQEDMDAAMDSGDEEEIGENDDIMQEILLQNDSSAHFDSFKDSIFCIAQHPVNSNIVATGGSEGEDAGGIGYIFDSTPEDLPVLPASYNAAPNEPVERKALQPIFTMEGHTDSINALTFTLPSGEFLLSGGLDGKLQAYYTNGRQWKAVATAQEVEEINWLEPCPNPDHPNTVALGANDGSVWVYTVDKTTPAAPLRIVQSYFLHTEACTAGSWTSDGKMLATVSEDGSLYVWDVFGEAAAAGVMAPDAATVLGLTALDQRFAVEGGLFTVAVAPSGAFLIVGGAGGAMKVIGLPRVGATATGGAKAKVGKGQKGAAAGTGQSGQILADLSAQSDNIETIAFASLPSTTFAAGSTDGSIAVFDSAYRFAVRRHIKEAHENWACVKVEFVKNSTILTSCGMDGVVRRWDTRGGTAAAGGGLVGEWKGHRGEGEGGGVLGFVQGAGSRIVTAGDDGISLVFEAPL